jgi:hypothetical protein
MKCIVYLWTKESQSLFFFVIQRKHWASTNCCNKLNQRSLSFISKHLRWNMEGNIWRPTVCHKINYYTHYSTVPTYKYVSRLYRTRCTHPLKSVLGNACEMQSTDQFITLAQTAATVMLRMTLMIMIITKAALTTKNNFVMSLRT